MSTFRAEEYERRVEDIDGWSVGITTYRLRDRWACRVDNVSPGATVARAYDTDRTAAVERATAKARSRLGHTRRVPPL